eukprot:TRINITY_DN10828_c0_g1_i1.p1 TRINITY_DN10828_c0_g1~~TRINITY_DN10828_c0_g1_i1.p1  ORF type:complete len:142 (+),score=43.26 TRINITY_DN10828_c0_g1_i1:3-428(+)
MGWLTSVLCVGLLVAICSVHRHDTLNISGKPAPKTDGKKEGTLNLDLKDMMNLAKQYLGEDNVEKLMGGDYSDVENLAKTYLGEDGVEKLMGGDYSDVEKIGKQIFGGEMEGSEILNTLLKAIPEGTLGKKRDESEEPEAE